MPLPAQGMKLNVDGSRVGAIPTFRPYQSPASYQQSLNPVAPAGLNQSGEGMNEVPAWQPPAQIPQQDQGSLFNQGNDMGASVPTWQPPVQMANPANNPVLGMNRNQTRQYQSPSSRYARNQMTF